MSRSERPADTRDFYTPALGALVTTGAATSHPATYGPKGGTAAAVRQTHRSTGCHARTGGAHGQRPTNYVPPPRLPGSARSALTHPHGDSRSRFRCRCAVTSLRKASAWCQETPWFAAAQPPTRRPRTAVVAPTGQTQLRHRELAPRGTGVATDRTCTYRSIAATGRGGGPRGPAAGWVRLTPSHQCGRIGRLALAQDVRLVDRAAATSTIPLDSRNS